MSAPVASPGVRFPPPLIFIIGWAAGYALERYLFSWALVGPSMVLALRVLAGLFGLAALWLLASALGGFRRRGNDPRPWEADTALVEEGIYRHTRNPMYLGMALAYAGIAAAANTLWPLLTLGPVLFVVRHYVIGREEAYLMQRFGAAYAAYCARVPRWL